MTERIRPASRWPMALVALGALVLVAYLVTIDRCARAPAELAGRVERMLRGVLSGDVTTRFLSSLPTSVDVGSGRLEVAILETVETVTETDERRALWDLVSLGATTVEIRVPVTWRWYVPVDATWRATVADGVLLLEAPALEPSLPPAIHTDRLEKRFREDWLRFDGVDRLAVLERELTPTLAARSREPHLLAPAREEARRTLTRLAGLWLRLEEGPDAGGVRAVSVRFADDPPAVDGTPPAPLVLP